MLSCWADAPPAEDEDEEDGQHMLEVEADEEVEVETEAEETFIGAEVVEAAHIMFPSSDAAFDDVDDEDDALDSFIIQFASFGFLFLRPNEFSVERSRFWRNFMRCFSKC